MRARDWVAAVLSAGVAGALLHPGTRTRTARLAANVAGGTAAVVARPTDELLLQARTRVIGALPVPADTKWRLAESLFRGAVVALIRDQTAATSITLHATGRGFARTARSGWDDVSVAEACQRLTQTLRMDGSIRRGPGEIVLVTRACALLDDVPASSRKELCEAVCGETRSLFAGVAESTGSILESPARMGAGDASCERIFRLRREQGHNP